MELSHYSWPMAAYAACAAAWFVSMLLVLTKSLHGRYSMGETTGVQCFHIRPTPRIGGIALVFGVLLGALLGTGELRHLLLVTLLISAPAFAFGLLEDCTHRVSAGTRLFATLGSGVLAWFVTGISITDVNVPWLDPVLLWAPAAVLFTALAVGGLANAFNIIDGFNGLAAGTAIIALSAMSAVSLMLGDLPLSHLCLVLAAATLGFTLLNWPRGALFLGDGGAYFLGFAVAWVAVLLLQRQPVVSAWCPLLVCAYPVLEVLFSMLRRRHHKSHMGHPDHLHLHSLVKRRVVRHVFPGISRLARNSVTGALLWFATLLPGLWAVWFYDNTPALALGLVVFAAAYQLLYLRLVRFGWHWAAQARPAPALSTSK